MSNTAQAAPEVVKQSTDHSPNPLYLPFRQEVFDTCTPLQIRIFLAAREVALRGNGTQAQIARLADSSPSYVTRALSIGVNRHDLPVVYTLATQCIGDKSYSDLTVLQQQIINYRIVLPEASFYSIAQRLGCATPTVIQTCRQYSDIIAEKTPGTVVPKTSSKADDVPIDTLKRDHRNAEDISMSVSVRPDSPLFNPFSKGLLEAMPAPYRHTLLAAREWAIRGTPTYKPLANIVNLEYKRIRNIIRGFCHYADEYPTAAAIAAIFAPNHRYDSLTDAQQEVVNRLAIDPKASARTIADQCGLSRQYVRTTRKECRGIIHKRRQSVGAPQVNPTVAFRLNN